MMGLVIVFGERRSRHNLLERLELGWEEFIAFCRG